MPVRERSMWQEPLVIIGLVVIASAVVCGIIAVFAGENGLAIITILLAFVGTSIVQLKNTADTKVAAVKADEAKNVAAETREEAQQARKEAVTGRREVKEKLKDVAQEVTEVKKSITESRS